MTAGSWSARIEVDPIAATIVAFDLYPQVEAIERRLKDAIRSGRIARAPQNLTLLNDWAATAEGLGLIDAGERAVIARFATYADQAIQVDDFPADFDIAAGLERRQAVEAGARKTTKKAA
ncbi:acyl-CoA dehydrogenase [compost metagenome]